MSDESSERLQKVEASLAHLENQVEQLNEVVIEQGKVIERMKKEVQKQSAALGTMELERMKSNNPKPPHYQ
jgi:uncharacterized coiled-coil protein SlyX